MMMLNEWTSLAAFRVKKDLNEVTVSYHIEQVVLIKFSTGQWYDKAILVFKYTTNIKYDQWHFRIYEYMKNVE